MHKVKFFIIIFVTLIFSNSAFAVSKGQWNALYKGCYSQKDGMTTKFWKAYCKCNANKYDANFSEQELAKWEKTVGNPTSNPTVVKFARQCYDKHK